MLKRMSHLSDAFSNAQAVARDAEDATRKVPGFADLQRMTTLLLEERAPEDARILVLGVGGGLELKTFAQARPLWKFDGIDPSLEMLKLAEQTLGPLLGQVNLQQGYLDLAPAGPFDGATCLRTLHFLTNDERRHTVAEVHRRLKHGAPFVVAHASFPQEGGQRGQWLSRYAAFAAASGIEREKAEGARAAIDKRLNILTPEQDEAMLRDGFLGREPVLCQFLVPRLGGLRLRHRLCAPVLRDRSLEGTWIGSHIGPS